MAFRLAPALASGFLLLELPSRLEQPELGMLSISRRGHISAAMASGVQQSENEPQRQRLLSSGTLLLCAVAVTALSASLLLPAETVALVEAEPPSRVLHGRELAGKGWGRGRGRGRGKGRGRGRGRGRRRSSPPAPPPPPHGQQQDAAAGGAERAAACKAMAKGRGVWDLPQRCRRTLPCDIRAFDPGARFNRDIVRPGRVKQWAKHNIDPANRHFQNGVEWWVQRALPPATRDATQLHGAHRVFVAAYFSYMWIFGSHLAQPAAEAARAKLGPRWRGQPERYVVAHGHPGSCIAPTEQAVRLVVDADLSCGSSARPIPVPYVVSRPRWLVAASLPDEVLDEAHRTTLLFFRGHLPRHYVSRGASLRGDLFRQLQGQPGIVMEAATSTKNASYQAHDLYLKRMMRSSFCLAPRGDSASSRRLYEAVATGCIPVIIADRLQLPFSRRIDWSRFSIRLSERDAVADPLSIVRAVRAVSPTRVASLRAALLEARPHFLFHLDPSRPSAVDQILQDICAGPPPQVSFRAWGLPQ